MTPRRRAVWQLAVLIGVAIVLVVLFPAAFRFVEAAARELRYMWWLILLVVLACWLIWGVGKKPKE